jgi:TnpA family transposase
MTAIDRTAYPRLGVKLTSEELQARYDLSETDHVFLSTSARGDAGRLALATLLKTRQDVGWFPALNEVEPSTITHIATQLGLIALPPSCEESGERTISRYRVAVRTYLSAAEYGEAGEKLIERIVITAAETMSDPADLINTAIEALYEARIDLPAFSSLDRLVNHLRTQVHIRMYDQVVTRLSPESVAKLEALLVVPPGGSTPTTPFNRLKQTPGPARLKAIKLWAERLEWLNGLPEPDPILEGIAHTKLRQFAAECAALEVSELLDMSQPGRRHTLLLCLIRQTRTRARDEQVEMLLRRVRLTRTAAKEKLAALLEEHQSIEEALIAALGDVLATAKDDCPDDVLGKQIKAVLKERGGVDHLTEQCESVSAYHGNNHLPLLWPIHANVRSVLFRLLELLDIRSATQDGSLLAALRVVTEYRQSRRDTLPGAIDLSFASQRWHSFVFKRQSELADRRALEVCAFVHLAAALESGDVYVVGAERFADYREQLLPWAECQPRLAAYCAAVGIPTDGEAFVAQLKDQLTKMAAEVDVGFPKNSELTIDADGKPHLKQLAGTSDPEGFAEFEREVRSRMPERHLLDILKHTEFWTRFTRHFGPSSGSDPKLANAVLRYLFTVFCYGCNLGPNQTGRHAPKTITAQILRRLNAQHINAEKIEAAMADIINALARFPLPGHWGDGHTAIADGTHVKLRENNLLGSRHIRYGGYGAIAYHHITNSYIALFTSFITCGVWEAVHILDGLLKDRSDLNIDTLHADTQGQAEPVFGLSRLLAIKLMPRMRNWADVIFYCADKSIRYQHIDALFTQEIDWELIAKHWQDMMQVVISIQAGRVLPSMLLRKLSTYNRKNRLYRAFCELGRVERTLFLLRYISKTEVRYSIRHETTKVESYNDFLDWVTFGGPVVKSGDPVEQEKQLKYASLVANAIMLSNVVDLTEVLSSMVSDGLPVTPDLVARISPYLREQIRRFGRYDVDMDAMPEPLSPRPIPFETLVA